MNAEQIRRVLEGGQTWWVDGGAARQTDYAKVISQFEAEGYPVRREDDLVTVSPKVIKP